MDKRQIDREYVAALTRAPHERFQSRYNRQNHSSNRQDDDNDKLPWSSQLRVLLCGTRDPKSSLSLLCGYEDTLLKSIYSILVDYWKDAVEITVPAHMAARLYDRRQEVDFQEHGDEFEFVMPNLGRSDQPQPATNVLLHNRQSRDGFEIPQWTFLGSKKADRPRIAFAPYGTVEFPEPSDRNVNMLPFIFGDPNSLPEELQPYYSSVIVKCPVDSSQLGKVVYLTVNESNVEQGKTQRRAGLHIEAPGSISTEASFAAALEHHWGVGIAFSPDELHGGFFVASNIACTCRVWDALINDSLVVDSHGGMEHLRSFLGDGYDLAANELVWMTDKTPHEALPQPESGYRQFFRLVTSEISVWFAAHSTPNPKVPLPEFVQIIEGNKFQSTTELPPTSCS